MTNPPPVPPIAGLAVADDILVEGFSGLSLRNGIAKINCFTTRYDPSVDRNFRAASAVLSFSLPDLVEFSRALAETLETLRSQGALPPATGQPVTKAADGPAALPARALDGSAPGEPAAPAATDALGIHIEPDPSIR